MSKRKSLGQVVMRRTRDGGVRVSASRKTVATLSRWTGRIQRETDVPVSAEQTLFAYAGVGLELSDQAKRGAPVGIDLPEQYERVMAMALRIHELEQGDGEPA